ncbi:unnamed protein product [Rangifer tarandus platyrhynchus]|uniref:Uncharacterized protein n=1 Tax=Rangifer tarandus platyrhynchus TaxID=3082113 RepID=A0AC59Y4X0_RANTA
MDAEAPGSSRAASCLLTSCLSRGASRVPSRTQPALDRALLSANPRLTPAPVAGDAEPPPGGLEDVEIDVNPRQGL